MRTHPASGYGKHAARPKVRCPDCGRVLAGLTGTGYHHKWVFLPPHRRNRWAIRLKRCVTRGERKIERRMPRPGSDGSDG